MRIKCMYNIIIEHAAILLFYIILLLYIHKFSEMVKYQYFQYMRQNRSIYGRTAYAMQTQIKSQTF